MSLTRNLMLAVLVVATVLAVSRAELVWNGNFETYDSSAELDEWDWDNQVGEYKTYIHGNQEDGLTMSDFVTVSEDYVNPGETIGTKGARVEINTKSIWNGGTLRRTELIPNYNAGALQSGKLYFKWSMKQGSTDSLLPDYEHQLVFFEAHYADIKYGSSQPGGDDTIYFSVGGNKVWSEEFTPSTWFNFALEVDFTNSKVALWHSKGGQALSQVVEPTSVGVSADSEFHLGNLRVQDSSGQQPDHTEVLYYSGVYVEDSLSGNLNGGAPDLDGTGEDDGADGTTDGTTDGSTDGSTDGTTDGTVDGGDGDGSSSSSLRPSFFMF